MRFFITLALFGAISVRAQPLPGLIPYLSQEGLWGYCDSAKKIIIPFRFSHAEPFCGDSAEVRIGYGKRAWVRKDGTLGRIDSVNVPPVHSPYDNPWSTFSLSYDVWFHFPFMITIGDPPRCKGGPFPVRNAAGRFGYVNCKRDTVIPCRFESADAFSEGLAFVVADTSSGFIDKKGKWVLHFSRQEVVAARPFKNGLCLFTDRDGVDCVMDREGVLVLPPSVYTGTRLLSPGTIVSRNDEGLYFADKKGRMIGADFFEEVGEEIEGMLTVVVKKKNARYHGFADSRGRIVIPCVYDWVSHFSEGRAVVALKGKYGIIDKKGKFVSPPQWDRMEPFSDGRAIVQKDDKYGYVDREGKLIIPLIFHYAEQFNSQGNHLANVATGEGYGMIDREGNIRIPCRYSEPLDFNWNLAAVCDTGGCGYIDTEGRVVIPMNYSEAKRFDSYGRAAVSEGGGYALIDTAGKVLTPFHYGYRPVPAYYSYGLYLVRGPEGEYYVDINGVEYVERRTE